MAHSLKKALLGRSCTAFRGLAYARKTCHTNIILPGTYVHAYTSIATWRTCAAAAYGCSCIHLLLQSNEIYGYKEHRCRSGRYKISINTTNIENSSIKFNTQAAIHYSKVPPQAFVVKVNHFFRESKPPGYNTEVKWDKEESDVEIQEQQLELLQGQQRIVVTPSTSRHKLLKGYARHNCFCSPCVIQSSPAFLVGSSTEHVADNTKRFTLSATRCLCIPVSAKKE